MTATAMELFQHSRGTWGDPPGRGLPSCPAAAVTVGVRASCCCSELSSGAGAARFQTCFSETGIKISAGGWEGRRGVFSPGRWGRAGKGVQRQPSLCLPAASLTKPSPRPDSRAGRAGVDPTHAGSCRAPSHFTRPHLHLPLTRGLRHSLPYCWHLPARLSACGAILPAPRLTAGSSAQA